MFGLFCEYRAREILVLIPELSWIPSFASCEQVAAVGDELAVKVIHTDRQRNKIAGSVIALHPESDPWHGAWQLGVGDVVEATVVRWVEKADRCGDAGGYLLALRPAALVMLCGQDAGRLKSGDRCAVTPVALRGFYELNADGVGHVRLSNPFWEPPADDTVPGWLKSPEVQAAVRQDREPGPHFTATGRPQPSVNLVTK